MLINIKNNIQNMSDKKLALLASILPISIMIFWHYSNAGLPFADANDFIGASGAIVNHFYNGDFLKGFYELYSGKPWRPVSFYLLLFPFMLISGNNILFTGACVHIICLFFIIIYSYHLLRCITDCKSSSFIGASLVGLLSGSFFPGGDSYLFAETALTPAVIGVIYHLYKSNFMISKKHSFYALIAMLIAFTVRPIEALLHLGPVLIYFFYSGYKNKVFSKKLILNILQVIILSIFLLSLKGLDITVDQRISNIDEFKAAELYEYLFKFLLIIIIILVIPLIYSLGRKFLYYLRLSKDNSGSYVLIIFSLFSFFILFWFADAWRDLYTWIYRTQLGDVARVTNTESSFLKLPNSLAELFNRFYFQITHAGLIPFIVTFFSSLIVFIYKIKERITNNSKLYLYLFYGLIIPIIPVMISISNTPRKFQISYILIIIFLIAYSYSINKITKFIVIFYMMTVSFQSASLINITKLNDNSYSQYVSGNFLKPRKESFETKIIEIINRNSSVYNFKNVDLAFMYPGIDHDIFTANMLSALIPKKTFYTSLPVIFEDYKSEWLINRLKKIHAVFLINPYGSMEISEKFSKVFKNDYINARFPQEKLYSELMHFYFSRKLEKSFNYISIECMDFPEKNNAQVVGCLLINRNIVKNNEN